MILSSNATDLSQDDLGLVELAASYLNDRRHLKWSKSELIVYINMAQYRIAAKINQHCRTFFLTSATTPLVAGQAVYSVPSDLARLMQIEIVDDASDTEPQGLREILLRDKDFYSQLDAANEKSDHAFFFLSGTTFELRPQVADPISGLARIHYVKAATQMTADSDVSEIPIHHHELLALGASIRAAGKKGQQNRVHTTLYNEGLDDLLGEIALRSPQREETVEMDHLDWGPSLIDPLIDVSR